MQRPARRVLAEAAHSAPERSSCSEASTTIEADLDSTSGLARWPLTEAMPVSQEAERAF